MDANTFHMTYRRWFDAGPRGYTPMFGYQIVDGEKAIRLHTFETAEERSQWERSVGTILGLTGSEAKRASAYLLLILEAEDEDEAQLGAYLMRNLVGPWKADALTASRP